MSVWSNWRTGDCPLAIEYTSRGRRVRRVFTTIQAARAFYLAKDRQGKDPSVHKASPPPPTLFDLPVRYFGDGPDGGDPLRPEAVCPACHHPWTWHHPVHFCVGRVDGTQCSCKRFPPLPTPTPPDAA